MGESVSLKVFTDFYFVRNMDADGLQDLLPHEMQTPLLFALVLVALIVLPQILCPFNTYKDKDD